VSLIPEGLVRSVKVLILAAAFFLLAFGALVGAALAKWVSS
jgi:hypothetical protein